jgi:alpha-D-ribose 1-methylphosphonate 5-triphosphate synthase subunit PhnL
MPLIQATVSCPVARTFRVEQTAGIFDLQLQKSSEARFAVEVPGADEDWTIGSIVGPSGSGKSTIARKAFGEALYAPGENWPSDKAVVDAFPNDLSIKQVTGMLSSVGFSSPPAWLRPYHVLSNGEKFRCDLARALLTGGSLVAVDEFTSVVDRTVAQVGSAAVAKAIRAGRASVGGGQKKFVAVTCHYDVVEWLQPDWVVDMATQSLARGALCPRPPIKLEIFRCHSSAWRLFARHHYLTAALNPSAVCFMASVAGQPVAFDAWLPFFGRLSHGKARRGHRTVCLPDYQGVGIGGALFTHSASLWKALGYRAFSCTAHPAEIAARARRPDLWRCTSLPTIHARGKHGIDKTRAVGRNTASFEYVGPALEAKTARMILGGGL